MKNKKVYIVKTQLVSGGDIHTAEFLDFTCANDYYECYVQLNIYNVEFSETITKTEIVRSTLLKTNQ